MPEEVADVQIAVDKAGFEWKVESIELFAKLIDAMGQPLESGPVGESDRQSIARGELVASTKPGYYAR